VSTLAQKLRIPVGGKVLLLECPEEVEPLLEDLPPGTSSVKRGRGPFPAVIGFVERQRDVERVFKQARAALDSEGVLWLAFPKKSSDIDTDIGRDRGWDALADRGWVPVSNVSIDDTWSALRFKHDPALKTLRSQRKAARRAELPTVKLKRVAVNAEVQATRRRKRRRSAPTIEMPGKKRGERKRDTQDGTTSRVMAPKDLLEALNERPEAKKRWSRMPPAVKEELLAYIDDVTRSDARARRIQRTVDDLEAD
jgi:hypothetical protein